MKSLLLIAFALSACNINESNNDFKERTKTNLTVKQKPLIISLQPFSDLSAELSNYVFNELKAIYPSVELNKSIPLPKNAFYSPRNRYRADSLIGYLNRINKIGHVTIGLTSKDISTTKNSNKDYGIMGLGYKPGNACVVSDFRLNKSNIKEQLFKVAIHELGHTQGLPHCPDPTCFMADAKGKNPIDMETDFCIKCKSVLIKKGWKLKSQFK